MTPWGMFNRTCEIRRKNAAKSSTTGGKSITYSSGGTVPCAIQVASASESRIAGRETGTTMYTVYMPYGTVVTNQDVLISDGGLRLEIVATPVDDAGRSSYLRCVCEELKGASVP